MKDEAHWARTRVVSRVDWQEGLFSVSLDTTPGLFSPGQCCAVGVDVDPVFGE